MRLNYLGPVHVTKALLPVMLPERSGATGRCIAFVSSAAAFVPVYGFTAYAASKAALAMFSNILQQELEDKKLSVTTVFPPDTDTPGLHVSILRLYFSIFAVSRRASSFGNFDLHFIVVCLASRLLGNEILFGWYVN